MAPTYPTIFDNPRKVFLIDGIGALLSAGLIIIVTSFEEFFGMPKSVLMPLMPLPVIFAVYSISCYLIKPRIWSRYLTVIATANILYACMTLSLVIYNFQLLTILGVTYFLSEILIIVLLAGIEVRLSKQLKQLSLRKNGID